MRAEDISKDVLARAIEIGESKVIDEVIEEMEGTNINCKHIAALFLSPEDTNGYDDAYDDELMMVFKTTYDYDSGEDIRHYTEYYVVEAEYLTANEIDNVEDWNMLVDSLYFGDDVEDIVDIDKMRSDLAEIGYEVTLLK